MRAPRIDFETLAALDEPAWTALWRAVETMREPWPSPADQAVAFRAMRALGLRVKHPGHMKLAATVLDGHRHFLEPLRLTSG